LGEDIKLKVFSCFSRDQMHQVSDIEDIKPLTPDQIKERYGSSAAGVPDRMYEQVYSDLARSQSLQLATMLTLVLSYDVIVLIYSNNDLL